MKRFKEVINDIWRNYKTPIILCPIFIGLISCYSSEIDLVWLLVSYFIAISPLVLIIGYGIKEYFKK